MATNPCPANCPSAYCSYHCYQNVCLNVAAFPIVNTIPEGGYTDSDFVCVHQVTYNYTELLGPSYEADPSRNIRSSHITDLRVAINQERIRRGSSAYNFVVPVGLITGDFGAGIQGVIDELGESIKQWRSITYKPTKGSTALARDIDYIRIKVESMRKECLCNGDCGGNYVCACYNLCNCNY